MSRFARREPTLAPVETRAAFDPSWGASALGGGGGGRVSPHLAENLPAVLGAVEIIAGAISSLPASIVVDTPDGREPLPGAAATRLLQRPNAMQSWPAFVQSMVASLLLHGNSVAAIIADGRGGVAALQPVPWPWLLPQIVNGGAGARLVFDVTQSTPESTLLNLPRRLLSSEVIHVRARSDNGVIGRSVLSRAAGVVSEGLDAAEAARSVFRNGLMVGGSISTDRKLDDTQRKQLKSSMDEYRGSTNAGKALVLENGLKWSAMAMNAADAELLATRAFSVGEVARLFAIPEPMLMTGDSRILPDLQPYIAAFGQLTLAPIVNLFEAEFDELLPEGQHLVLDMGGLLRGSYQALAASSAVLVQSRILTANEARATLGQPNRPDGDALAAGAAPNYPADASGVPSLAPKPGPGGVLPNVGTHENEGAA